MTPRSVIERTMPKAATGIPLIRANSLFATSSQPLKGPQTGTPPGSSTIVR